MKVVSPKGSKSKKCPSLGDETSSPVKNVKSRSKPRKALPPLNVAVKAMVAARVSPPAAQRRGLTFAFDTLAQLVALIARYLTPLEALKLSIASKLFWNKFKSKEMESFWSLLLYSKEIDVFGCYAATIPLEQRVLSEEFYGPMKVVSALVSNWCIECGRFTSSFNSLACARACYPCWKCLDSGESGAESKSRFALCAVKFVTSYFLLPANLVTALPTMVGPKRRNITLLQHAKAAAAAHWVLRNR